LNSAKLISNSSNSSVKIVSSTNKPYWSTWLVKQSTAPSKPSKLHHRFLYPTMQRPHQPQLQPIWCKQSTTQEPLHTPLLLHSRPRPTHTPPPVQLLRQQLQQPRTCTQASMHVARIGTQLVVLPSNAITTRARRQGGGGCSCLRARAGGRRRGDRSNDKHEVEEHSCDMAVQLLAPIYSPLKNSKKNRFGHCLGASDPLTTEIVIEKRLLSIDI
jgi:hypothetical protein